MLTKVSTPSQRFATQPWEKIPILNLRATGHSLSNARAVIRFLSRKAVRPNFSGLHSSALNAAPRRNLSLRGLKRNWEACVRLATCLARPIVGTP
jgi:hypothetical protein